MSNQSNNGNTPKVPPPPPAPRPNVEIVFTELRENQTPPPHKGRG